MMVISLMQPLRYMERAKGFSQAILSYLSGWLDLGGLID